jgi:mannose-1-phosphate guanylyltransferase
MPFKDYVVQAFSTRPDVVKDMTIVSEDNLVIDDHQAYQAVIDYTFNIDGKTLSTRTMQTLIIDRGYGYIFTGSATKDTFGKYKQIFKDFTDSIKFK